MRTQDPTPLLYGELAAWWPLMSAPADYEEEATFYADRLAEACSRTPSVGSRLTLLELGSGGGNNASYLRQRFTLTLVEPSEGMLAVSRALNPECEHVRGDMRDVRLDRQFDLVFVHDAVSYMQTEDDLRRALQTVRAHLAPGGAALIAPDHFAETFRGATDCGGHDGPDGRALRYLEWSWDPDPTDTHVIADYTYTLREADGTVRVVHDRHHEGLFPRATWHRLLEEAGLIAKEVPFDHSELEPGSYAVFVATG